MGIFFRVGGGGGGVYSGALYIEAYLLQEISPGRTLIQQKQRI